MNQKNRNRNQLKAHPFRVPDQYFDDLKAQVMEKTVSGSHKKVRLLRPWLQYAAAAVLLFALVGGWFIYDQSLSSEQDRLAAGVEAELYSYDMEMLQNYSEMGIESELTNEDDAYLIQSDYVNETVLYGND